MLLELLTFVAVVGAMQMPAKTTMDSGYWPLHTAAPTPTPALQPAIHLDLFRRQAQFTSVCGYYKGNASQPLRCDSTEYCGFNSGFSAFGCCTTATSGTLYGCDFVRTCYGASAFSASCDDVCQSNTLAGWCTETDMPYCSTYVESGYSAFACGAAAGVTYQLQYTPTASGLASRNASTTASSRTASSSSSVVLSTSIAGTSSSGTASAAVIPVTPSLTSSTATSTMPSIVPFTQTQHSSSQTSTTGPATVSTTQAATSANVATVLSLLKTNLFAGLGFALAIGV